MIVFDILYYMIGILGLLVMLTGPVVPMFIWSVVIGRQKEL